MKTTIFIILLILATFARGQTGCNYPDTVPALILISDTAHFPVQIVAADSAGKRMIITEDRQDDRIHWINGFIAYCHLLPSGYVDENKKKLGKNIVVWMFKLKTHDN